MKSRCRASVGGVGAAWVLVGLMLVTVVPLHAPGAERVVLCEEFTATW